jgi:hypothetical protein
MSGEESWPALTSWHHDIILSSWAQPFEPHFTSMAMFIGPPAVWLRRAEGDWELSSLISRARA